MTIYKSNIKATAIAPTGRIDYVLTYTLVNDQAQSGYTHHKVTVSTMKRALDLLNEIE